MDSRAFLEKRWFKNSGAVKKISQCDSLKVGQSFLQIWEVIFEDGTIDFYATLADESTIGEFLYAGFFGESNDSLRFIFNGTPEQKNSLARAIKKITPLSGEQSNSSFTLSDAFFFKWFRRLQPGVHPEIEMLEHLQSKNFLSSPTLLGYCLYTFQEKTYAIGLLENFIPNKKNAWDLCLQTPDKFCAQTLGETVAHMHSDLKNLPASFSQKLNSTSFETFENLLTDFTFKNPIENFSSKSFSKNSEKFYRRFFLAKNLHSNLPILKEKFESALFEISSLQSEFPPQRIHGDLHLGQILFSNEQFQIIDFEGEPSETFEIRKSAQSILVDLASLIRSFRYAEFVSGFSQEKNECAFLSGYAQKISRDATFLKKALAPFILLKTFREASYELAFRPDWFEIPAQALLETCV